MMRRIIVFLLLTPLCFTANSSQVISNVVFGSCLRQWKPQPIWDAIVSSNPDIFLFIGDNVYADTTDSTVMRRTYQQLGSQDGYKKLKSATPIHATWDDHDYGANDAGADYPMREESEQIFLDFFGVPAGAPERKRPGVYSTHMYGPPEQRLQIIMLDTRYFRSPLKRDVPSADCPRVNHAQNTDADATILGSDQWVWLEEQLRKPARLRIIASSIQVIPDEHCFEKWSNFPLERERLFQTIRNSNATGLLIISGDRHLAEISRLDPEVVGYPLYEITSSGMNSAGAGQGERNRYRIDTDNFRGDNFGAIRIDWDAPSPHLALQVRNQSGNIVKSHFVPFNEIDVIDKAAR